MSHMPGLWSVEKTPAPWNVKVVGAAETANGDPVNVCMVVTDAGSGIAEYISEPDARLIAAAPDLLEALKECELLIPYTTRGGLQSVAMLDLQARVRAAIAKAEGK